MSYLDEILEVDSKAHPRGDRRGCGCSKCRSKRGAHPINCSCPACRSQRGELDQEGLTDWLRSKYDSVTSTLKRAFSCSVLDLTASAKPKSNAINRARTPRDLKKIDAVVLHQMAFSRGSNLNKYLRVTSHYIIMPDGKVGQLHPDTTYLNASNSLNRRSVAIEFAGNFPNTRGRCWNASKFGCHTLTKPQIDAGRCLLAELKRKLPSMKFVFAHRQSRSMKSNDPGPDIWRNVAEWGIAKLGYDPASRTHKEPSSGQPIPAAWL